MEYVLPGWFLFDPENEAKRNTRVERGTDSQLGEERRLFCAACNHPITTQDARTIVQGGHEHTFTNPHGLAFHIGCFRSAPGCVAIGVPTTAHTWFRGYAWMIGLCGNCERHIGWLFRSPADDFHGLILSRLTSRAGGAP